MTVAETQDAVDLSQPAVSRRLALMRALGVVSAPFRGQRVVSFAVSVTRWPHIWCNAVIQ